MVGSKSGAIICLLWFNASEIQYLFVSVKAKLNYVVNQWLAIFRMIIVKSDPVQSRICYTNYVGCFFPRFFPPSGLTDSESGEEPLPAQIERDSAQCGIAPGCLTGSRCGLPMIF
jgi:hypothetical protein